jgi:hypothetical protein
MRLKIAAYGKNFKDMNWPAFDSTGRIKEKEVTNMIKEQNKKGK